MTCKCSEEFFFNTVKKVDLVVIIDRYLVHYYCNSEKKVKQIL